MVIVDNVGLSDNLTLFWTTDIIIDLFTLPKSRIDVKVVDINYIFRLLGIYGDSKHTEKNNLWANQRRKKNTISSPIGSNRNTIHNREDVVNLFLEYYSCLFKSFTPNVQVTNEILQATPHVVTHEMRIIV